MSRERFGAAWYALKNKHGFLLAELQISIAAAALLLAVIAGCAMPLLANFRKAADDIQLQDAGRYMLTVLAKDWGYDSSRIILNKDFRGRRKVSCTTVFAGKQYFFTLENGGLYKLTRTLGTKGKNPLFIPDCRVQEWQVSKVSDRALLVEFSLKKGARQRRFRQFIYCVNGSVSADE